MEDQQKNHSIGSLVGSNVSLAYRVILGTAMFLMLAVTFIDVLGRYIFSAPVYGSYELMEFLLAIAAFAALPQATLRREHVTVSIFAGLFAKNKKVEAIKELIIDLITAAIFSFAGYIMWLQGVGLKQIGTNTSIFEFPLYIIAYFTSIVLYWTALLALYMGIRDLIGRRRVGNI